MVSATWTPISALELWGWLWRARSMSHRLAPQAMFRRGGAIASTIERHLTHQRGAVPESIEPMAVRLSRLVPGAHCMDRAWAARWFLARRATPSRVVVGLRRASPTKGAWEGHAWLEFEQGAPWFIEPGAGYKEIAREP